MSAFLPILGFLILNELFALLTDNLKGGGDSDEDGGEALSPTDPQQQPPREIATEEASDADAQKSAIQLDQEVEQLAIDWGDRSVGVAEAREQIRSLRRTVILSAGKTLDETQELRLLESLDELSDKIARSKRGKTAGT